ncbi:hypothetical protein ACTVJH_05215 [Desulfoplanes sp. PS50]
MLHKRCITTLILPLILGAGTMALGIMAPEYYAERSENARIKAIGTIDRIDILEVGKYCTTKRVIFCREFGLTAEVGPVFNGTCKSVETDFQKRHGMVGPTIYFYPRQGDRVYVTITEPGGAITSLTPVTPELEKALRTAPETIRYGMSRVFVQE